MTTGKAEIIVHVLPLSDDHDESPQCWCGPIVSMQIGDDRLYVHRTRVGLDPPPFAMIDRT